MGGLHIARGASLDFDEAENVFASVFRPSDQIDLAAMTCCTEIPRHHHVAFSSQVEIGILFTATTGAEVGGDGAGKLFSRQPIQPV